ncbi:MAG: hypothetical protein KBE04_06500 [Phycisphaerae bacterium]|nr:hypothetical protein [Phycisphaerae bacterium]
MKSTPPTEKGWYGRPFLACVVGCTLLWPLCQATSAQGQESPLGDLRIEGSHIKKLVLEGGDAPHTEDLTDPNANVRFPVGTYEVKRIELQGGYTSSAAGLGALKRIAVMEDTPDVLKVGGPLRQEIKVSRQGRMLVLDYQLLGGGGERYVDTSRRNPPRFTVFRGETAIASGQFAFG